MSVPCTLTGGGFQDSEGNVLANGYLTFRLNQDASVGGESICSGIEVTINLDASGNAVSGSQIWGNDVLSPVNTFYQVTGYTSQGQPAWGPNNQQVTGTSFDLGTWVPNQVISWTPALSTVTLQHSGVNNSSQTLLNLESTDSSITITDEGGGTINLQSAATTPTAQFMYGPGRFDPVPGGFAEGPITDSALRVYCTLFNTRLSLSFTTLSLFGYSSAAGGGDIAFAIYDKTGNTLLWTSPTTNVPNQAGEVFTKSLTGFPTLAPGSYYLAWTATANTSCFGFPGTGIGVVATLDGANKTVFGYSANAATESGGVGGTIVFPSSLGTLATVIAATIYMPGTVLA